MRCRTGKLFSISIIFLSLALSGCSEKAAALKLAVTQFETESIAAVNAIDEMRQWEIAPAPRSSAQATHDFVSNILSTPANDINSDLIALALDTDTVAPDETSQQKWDDLLGGLRNRHSAFALIFARIEEASFTAAEKVKKALPIARKLVAELAYFANATEKHPPLLIQHRGALTVELRNIRRSGKTSAEQTPLIAVWKDKWVAMEADEAEMKRKVVEQCLKAATVGVALTEKIETYDQVSVADISNAIGVALQTASDLTGRDYAKLNAKAASLAHKVATDPVWKSASDQALARVNAALAKRQ